MHSRTKAERNPKFYEPNLYEPNFYEPNFYEPNIHEKHLHSTHINQPHNIPVSTRKRKLHEFLPHETNFVNTNTYIDLNDMKFNNKSIFSLSSANISNTALHALGLGLKHVPVPQNEDPKKLLQSHDELAKSIRTRKYFIKEENSSSTTLNKLRQRCDYTTSWEPPKAGQFLEQYITHSRTALESLIAHMSPTSHHKYQPELIKALLELKNNKNIIIKSADKNLGPVIMDKDEYISLATNNKNLGDTTVYHKFLNKPRGNTAHKAIVRILIRLKYVTIVAKNYTIRPCQRYF